MKKSALALITLGSAALAVAACSSKPPPPPNPPTTTVDAGAEAGAVTMAPADAGAPVAAADAGSSPPFFTGGADAGAPVAPPLTEAALDAAIDLALGVAAPKLAPKMDKEGPASHSTLAEGQHFSMMVNLAPGRCYTIVATSLPANVSQLDLRLYGPPLFNVEAGKSSPADKLLPVIGKGTTALCPIIPIAVPYKVDLGATKGSGRVGVQVYSRAK